MMSLTFGLFTQVSGSGPLGPLVFIFRPKLKFISWTKCELQPSQELKHLNIVPPGVGIEVGRRLLLVNMCTFRGNSYIDFINWPI